MVVLGHCREVGWKRLSTARKEKRLEGYTRLISKALWKRPGKVCEAHLLCSNRHPPRSPRHRMMFRHRLDFQDLHRARLQISAGRAAALGRVLRGLVSTDYLHLTRKCISYGIGTIPSPLPTFWIRVLVLMARATRRQRLSKSLDN